VVGKVGCGNVGIVGKVGCVGCGNVGIVGKVGCVGCGKVGIEGKVGCVGFGKVGTTGAVVCKRLRAAAKLLLMLEKLKTRKKAKMSHDLGAEGAITEGNSEGLKTGKAEKFSWV